MIDPGQPLIDSHEISPQSSHPGVHDRSIDTVLTALRETEPSPGLDRRLLATLALHQTATAIPSAHRVLPIPSAVRAVGWLSLAATLLLVLSFLQQHRTAFRAAPARNTSITSPSTPSPSTPSTSTVAVARSTGSLCCLSTRSDNAPYSALNHGAPRRPNLKASATTPVSHLASFPAPPLPLTDQEKLLLRVARAHNPQQSPILNPTLRASLAARDDESFQVFFAPATTIKPYEPSN